MQRIEYKEESKNSSFLENKSNEFINAYKLAKSKSTWAIRLLINKTGGGDFVRKEDGLSIINLLAMENDQETLKFLKNFTSGSIGTLAKDEDILRGYVFGEQREQAEQLIGNPWIFDEITQKFYYYLGEAGKIEWLKTFENNSAIPPSSIRHHEVVEGAYAGGNEKSLTDDILKNISISTKLIGATTGGNETFIFATLTSQEENAELLKITTWLVTCAIENDHLALADKIVVFAKGLRDRLLQQGKIDKNEAKERLQRLDMPLLFNFEDHEYQFKNDYHLTFTQLAASLDPEIQNILTQALSSNHLNSDLWFIIASYVQLHCHERITDSSLSEKEAKSLYSKTKLVIEKNDLDKDLAHLQVPIAKLCKLSFISELRKNCQKTSSAAELKIELWKAKETITNASNAETIMKHLKRLSSCQM